MSLICANSVCWQVDILRRIELYPPLTLCISQGAAQHAKYIDQSVASVTFIEQPIDENLNFLVLDRTDLMITKGRQDMRLEYH